VRIGGSTRAGVALGQSDGAKRRCYGHETGEVRNAGAADAG
jgi:hypothetical protein